MNAAGGFAEGLRPALEATTRGLQRYADLANEAALADDRHAESVDASSNLLKAYFENVKAGHHTLGDFTRQVNALADAEGMASDESAMLRELAKQLRSEFVHTTTGINNAADAVRTLNTQLHAIPSSVSTTHTLVTSGTIAAGTARARASGGPVTAHTPYLVGERGPELIIPRSNGTVIPNHQLNQGGMQQINISLDRGEVASVITKQQRRNDILLCGRFRSNA